MLDCLYVCNSKVNTSAAVGLVIRVSVGRWQAFRDVNPSQYYRGQTKRGLIVKFSQLFPHDKPCDSDLVNHS